MPTAENADSLPPWATAGNYNDPGEDWDGLPRVESTGLTAFASEGFTPDAPTEAQLMNEWLQRVETAVQFFLGNTTTPGAGMMGGLYGDGTHGAATITGGTTTLTGDRYYTNLTVTGTGVLVTAGFRVFVAGLLTVQAGGVIHNDGAAAVGHTAGTGAPAGSLLGGGDGAAGVSNASGQNGDAATGLSRSLGGDGATGGATTTYAGGVGGTAQDPIANDGGWQHLAAALGATHLGDQWRGGTGGGSGATENGSGTSGGGGGGGGVVSIHALAVFNEGTIRADGGAGGTPTSTGDSDELGGGAGGGGGTVFLVHRIAVAGSLGTVQASGGAGGTGYDGASDGGIGFSGRVITLVG